MGTKGTMFPLVIDNNYGKNFSDLSDDFAR
jgi:hypothetical protein